MKKVNEKRWETIPNYFRMRLFKLNLPLFLLMFMLPFGLFAQSSAVTGTVVDSDNEPLIGASVLIKGTQTGTMTDIDGNFSIQASPSSTLVITYMGMQTKEVMVGNRSKLQITLSEDASIALDEVVAIGYGVQRKADLTTSVSSVSSDEWADRPIISAQQALQGKAAGVEIRQPSGKPGEGASVRVRGTTSLNAGNDPLYVVDGIPTNDINNISPNDIETMSILKDASSAAIYGARAANGVILITTKQGVKGKAQINFSSYVGFSNVSKKIETLNTQEFYDLMDDLNISVDHSNNHYTDWEKELYGTGVQQNYQLSLSGGAEKVNYYISGGYQKETGIIAPSEYDRFSFRSNVNGELTNWLKITSNASFARNSKLNTTDNRNAEDGGVVMGVLNTPPYLEIWDKNNPGQYASNPFNAGWENPLAQASTHEENMEYRFMGNVGLDFTLWKGLHFKPSIAVDYTSASWDKFIDPVKTNYGRQANGRGEHSDDDWLTWTNENILTYTTKINDSHNLVLMGGATFMQHEHENTWLSGQDFVKGTTFENMTLNMANKIVSFNNYKEGYSLTSYLARAQYDFESRYLLTATVRADGSSKLHPDHRWGYFPSVSAGWRFSDEAFMESTKGILDDAKLRTSWGINGNQNGIGNYDYLDKYYISKTEESGNGPSIGLDRLGNKDLKWETTSQYNVGLDLSFLNGRFTAEFDYYYKWTKDLLLEINIPNTVGFKLPMRNDGEMMNKGFEYNLTGKILTGAFKWDASLNMSFNKNEVKKLSLTPQYTTGNTGRGGDVILVKEGLPLGTFFGYVAAGVDPETGDMIYEDLNPNGRTGSDDPYDRTVIGDAQPDFIFGFSHNFAWKNFSLGAFFQGSYGNDIYNASRMYTEGMYDSKNQSTVVLDRWRRPGMITDIPRAGNSENSLVSSRFVEDGSYLRLKTLTLAYNFEKNLISRIGLESLRLYATANNLFTLTKYKGYDPELNAGGGAAVLGLDMGTYPQTRSFIFGLNLAF